MATVTKGRSIGGQVHVMAYNGRESLLDLLDRNQAQFLDCLEEAARKGWISGDRWLDLEAALSSLVVKHDIPQSPG